VKFSGGNFIKAKAETAQEANPPMKLIAWLNFDKYAKIKTKI